ncbi:ankyrin repeat-containing domain protein [Baffinella frigidus]|nr:ankyrin repeat-containing domain protein [Cryptophyta sp. CCMP2293]
MRLHLYNRPDASRVWRAAYNGNVAQVQRLVRDGDDCYSIDPSCGSTPLQVAAWRGNTHVVRLLLSNATQQADGSCACVNVADVHGFDPLHYAMQGLHIEIARMFIAHGANANLNRASHFADKLAWMHAPVLMAATSTLPKVESSLRGHNGCTTCAQWAERRLGMMRLLLKNGAYVPPPQYGITSCYTLWELAMGFDRHRDRETPSTDMLELLIEYDRQVEQPGTWTLAHMLAALNSCDSRDGVDVTMLAVLAANKYSLETRDRDGNTPLHIAAEMHKSATVQFFARRRG